MTLCHTVPPLEILSVRWAPRVDWREVGWWRQVGGRRMRGVRSQIMWRRRRNEVDIDTETYLHRPKCSFVNDQLLKLCFRCVNGVISKSSWSDFSSCTNVNAVVMAPNGSCGYIDVLGISKIVITSKVISPGILVHLFYKDV